MAMENESINKKPIKTFDRFIIDTKEYLRKKNKKRVDEPTIIYYVFNKNDSFNVDREVVEKRINFKWYIGK